VCGAVIVVDARAVRGTGGVKGVAWGGAKDMGTARRAVEVSEAGDEGAALVLAVRPPLPLVQRLA
jgi:hypothetical protein